jgi:hypothetical protein
MEINLKLNIYYTLRHIIFFKSLERIVIAFRIVFRSIPDFFRRKNFQYCYFIYLFSRLLLNAF